MDVEFLVKEYKASVGGGSKFWDLVHSRMTIVNNNVWYISITYIIHITKSKFQIYHLKSK
jgi:hypothetical protein